MTTPHLKRFLPAAFCILTAMVCALSATAGPQPKAPVASLDLQAYSAQIRRCSDQIAHLGNNPAAIARFRQSLPPHWNVRAAGRHFQVSTAWLNAALAEIQEHPAESRTKHRQILNHLDFLRSQAELMATASPVPPASVARSRLNDIFRRPEFRGLSGPGPATLWWRRITSWIGDRLMSLFARLHLHVPTGNGVAYTLIAVALVLLSLGLYRNLSAHSRPDGRMGLASVGPLSAPDWSASVRSALDAAEHGDFRAAIHHAYWAAVARLEDVGVFPRDRSQTPRELLCLLDAHPDEKMPFRDLVARFELVWYGYRPPSAADWQDTRTQLERIGCLRASTNETVGS